MSGKMETFGLSSPIGQLHIEICDDHLSHIAFVNKAMDLNPPISPLAKRVKQALNDYFQKVSTQFNLPIVLNGSPFQNHVWDALQKIPFGSTLTYGQLATQLNTSPRAIGNACRTNPLPIVIPCHRIVGKHDLGGYSGQRAGAVYNIKQKLLNLEMESR